VTFQLINGILFRNVVTSKGDTQTYVVVPNELRESVMLAAHISLAGHLTAVDTMQHAKRDFWWPVIDGDVIKFCTDCAVCKQVSALFQL
jgi:hypothetical protein